MLSSTGAEIKPEPNPQVVPTFFRGPEDLVKVIDSSNQALCRDFKTYIKTYIPFLMKLLAASGRGISMELFFTQPAGRKSTK